jgi:glucosamine--fructose-6-phosphate aminotransferase (isomerizing)
MRRVADGSLVEREPEFYAGDLATAEKGGYPHFMLKEIYEQPRVAGELLRLLADSTDVPRFLDAIQAGQPVYLVGCGTSFHACLLGAYYFNQIAGISAVPTLPLQFLEQYGRSLNGEATVVFVSQSGETKDVLNAVKVAQAKRVRTLGILNVLGSTLMNAVQLHLPLACGYEISVPATKTFLNQVILFLYLAHRLAGDATQSLECLPDLLEATIQQTQLPAEQVAGRLTPWDDMYYLGYGITHPIALEGALKLKEITYAHCEGIFSSEFKHGPLSAVRQGYPVVFITAPQDVEMMINHVNEVTCRQGLAIAIAEENEHLRKNVQEYLSIPTAGQWLNPILAVVPTQLVAYHMSVKRGIDPDFPRNLSKTLTVD